ncbi:MULTISPECIES: PKD domain-containing protein [unclassified Methanoculleus]|jgi:PKD repeat protein|uniref:PKD domain-containing protein n=2 Tax=unclassified Methanoculleus TaxID=2619537 RepID=UPI00319E6D32
MPGDTAASDLIGVMALIAVFVTAVAIAGVALLSHPPGDAAPAMIARMETDSEGGTVSIYHDGGDPLEKGRFAILVDGVDRTADFSLIDAAGEKHEIWTSWKTGEALVLDTNGTENLRIQIVGEGVRRTGGDWLLHDLGNGTAVTPTTGPTPTETAGPTPVPLAANFTANVTYGTAPLAVRFTDTSTGGPTAWLWDFGDNATSTDRHPTHIYAAPGNYTVSLTVTRAGASDTETKTGYIIVSCCSSPGLLGTYYPTREFTGTPVQRVDQRLRFADAEAGRIYRCGSDEEDWPNSTLNKTEQFSVVYEGYLLVPADATYTFYLTSDDGSRLWIDAVDEGAEPLIDHWGYHKPEEKNSSIHLSAGSHPIKVKMFENNGAAVLYLEWSSPDFERKPVDSFCQGTVQVSANFTATPLNGTAPLEVQFTDASMGGVTSWFWNFGDGTTSTVQHPNHTYTAPGTYTVSLTASNACGFSTETRTDYITVLAPPVANFTANVTEGNAPLVVQFNDTSTGNVTSWSWDFGDGNTSTEQNPVHIYESPGNYTVSLTASNAYGNDTWTREDYIRVTKSFIDFIIDENVFVYGSALQFGGNNVNGPGATVIVTGGLTTSDLNGGASIAVTDIYIDGDVTLDDGSAGLGSAEKPGSIYVNGDLELWRGAREIYGDVYVAGNFSLKDAKIHGNVYVDGDLTLEWTPWIADDAYIYYTGTNTTPSNYNADILAKCIHQATVPGFTMPDQGIPSVKSDEWYATRGYVSGGDLTSNMKVFADSYTSEGWKHTATNVIIIARTGDITITGLGGSGVTGIFFAPNGKVTFNGAFLEGVVVARDGFDVTSGGTTVTFKNVEVYVSDPADYPF